METRNKRKATVWRHPGNAGGSIRGRYECRRLLRSRIGAGAFRDDAQRESEGHFRRAPRYLPLLQRTAASATRRPNSSAVFRSEETGAVSGPSSMFACVIRPR